MSFEEKVDGKLDRIIENQTHMKIEIAKNTYDVAEHIRRTNLMENKVQKLLYLVILGAGAGIAEMSPTLILFLKGIL